MQEKVKKYQSLTESLNKVLSKSLENFAHNIEWTDIYKWLEGLEKTFRQYPSPFIYDKVLLSKRLNQCLNHVLPQNVHFCVLRILQTMFKNIRCAAEENINDYVKMLAQDLGVYSVSILPYFTHTANIDHRIFCLKLINKYFIDLGRELIPMLPGLLKSMLPVLSTTLNEKLIRLIEGTLLKIMHTASRKYFIASMWSTILKYSDCKEAGIKILTKILPKMDYIKGEEQFSQSRGFSELQRQLMEQQIKQKQRIQRPSKTHSATASKKQSFPINSSPINILASQKVVPTVFQNQQLTTFNQEYHQQSPSTVYTNVEQIVQKDAPVQNQKKIVKTAQNGIIHEQQNEDSVDTRMEQLDLLFVPQEGDIRLNKIPLMNTPQLQVIKKGIDEDNAINNFPCINSIVLSALVSCLDEDAQIIRRATLDFMFTHLRIKSELLAESDRVVLVEALVRLFHKKELSTIKRVNRWLFGKQDDDNKYVISTKNSFVVDYIIQALRSIFYAKPVATAASQPLKILQNFYIEHPELVNKTLSEIALYVVRYIFNYGAENEGDDAEDVLKVGKRFLENLPSYYSIIFTSLGGVLRKSIEFDQPQKAFEAVKYIDFCYIKLMRHEHSLQQLEYITITLEQISVSLALLASKEVFHCFFLKDTVLLVYNLISRRESVQKFNHKEQERINTSYLIETKNLSLPPQRLQYQREMELAEESQSERYVKILIDLQVFFDRIGKLVRGSNESQEYGQTFKVAALAIVKLQLQLPKVPMDRLPKWFSTLEGGIKVNSPLVSLAAIDAMIKCLVWENKHPIYASCRVLIQQQKTHKQGTDYQKIALQKLWSLLDYPHMHSKIIDLIVDFSKYFPYEFTQTVKRSFETSSVPDKEASIQRFSHFWRLTGHKYRDLLSVHSQFVVLNKVGLYRMLDFLDDQNPLVRHAAKNWLLESMNLLSRVIEPLLHQLLTNCVDWYQTPRGLFLIDRVYDTGIIFSTFRRIRSILANGSYIFLKYVYQAQLSDSLERLREKISDISIRILAVQDQKPQDAPLDPEQREPVLPKMLESVVSVQKAAPRMSYLDLLVVVAMKYIEGHAIESMGLEFYVGSSAVNASAVEFIETLLDYIDNPVICAKLVNFIKEYLFKVLAEVVITNEYIMQIQLINLFKKIFFNSSFRSKGEQEPIRLFFKEVFTYKIFLEAILGGLHTPFAYVRSQFISFINICIPLIADFLDPDDCTSCIRRILSTYYQLIKKIGVNITAAVASKVEEESIQDGLNKIQRLQKKAKLQLKQIKFADNLKQVSKTNEIISVLHGVEAVLNYFYDLKSLDLENLGFQFSNPYTLFDTFKSVFTLGLLKTQKNAKLIEKRNFLHNFATCQALISDLEPVYETILRSWPLSQEFVRIGSDEFSSVGMRSFNFQYFNRYNKVAKQLIDYVKNEKESIWGKIFCIIQPMFCKFPTQIIEIYLKLWIRECSDMEDERGRIRPNASRTQLLMKITETIVVNNFPMNVVVHAFLESSHIEQLESAYAKKEADRKLQNVLSYSVDKIESKLLYFLYVYFNYVYLNEKELTKESLLEIWSLILKALKPFETSHSPLSAIWRIEILNLCSRKYSPKELLTNERFKCDLHALINHNLRYLASIAARKQFFYFKAPLQQDTEDKYHIVLPIPPTLYENSQSESKSNTKSWTKGDNRCLSHEKNPCESQAFTEMTAGQSSDIERRYRLYCFQVLKRVGLEVLQNNYLPQKTHWVVVRTCQWLNILLPIIEDKSPANTLYAQSASHIVFDLLERAKTLFVRDLRPAVLAIFNKDDFFICNVNTLKYWSKIVDWMVSSDGRSETYVDYLKQVSLESSYFASETNENKKRIKSFERICFILYSGTQDQYAKKLKELMQKIAQVLSKPEVVHPALLLLILFALRILILRLSQLSLSQLFLQVWPMLLKLLMQLFSSKQLVRFTISNQISKNPNLLLAALKLIQMLSLTNLNEFAHHQWLFTCEYFGSKYTFNSLPSQAAQLISRRPQLGPLLRLDEKENPLPFLFRPYLLNYSATQSVNYVGSVRKEAAQFAPQPRLIILKDSVVNDEKQLQIQATLFMQYLSYVSEYRTVINWAQVEEVIVNDFINLDKFIYHIN